MSPDTPPADSIPVRLAARALRVFRRALTDRSYRGMLLLRMKRPHHLFQLNNVTGPYRYPDVFRFVRSELGANGQKNLLSFGCSTGEEVFTLRHYFPDAFIKGIDINRGNISICVAKQKRTGDTRMSFKTAGSTAGEPASYFDAIFCMAVLRHGRLAGAGVERCDHLVRFEEFDAAISGFVRCLKPGGLLAVFHSNFRVCDASAAAQLEPVFQCSEAAAALSPVFGSNNRLLKNTIYCDVVFRKRADETAI